MKQKSQLRNKLEAFNKEIDDKRPYLKKENSHRMRLQTDQEGHAVEAEQKIREFKERLRNFKHIKKNRNLPLKKVTVSMNIQPKAKYGVAPEEVEKNL